MTVETLIPFLIAVVTGAAYAAMWFSTKVLDPTKPESVASFDPVSFVVTLTVGAIVGVISVYTNSPLTQMGVETQILAYGTQIAVARELIYLVYNRHFKKSTPATGTV